LSEVDRSFQERSKKYEQRKIVIQSYRESIGLSTLKKVEPNHTVLLMLEEKEKKKQEAETILHT
jgi:hypothetical protein